MFIELMPADGAAAACGDDVVVHDNDIQQDYELDGTGHGDPLKEVVVHLPVYYHQTICRWIKRVQLIDPLHLVQSIIHQLIHK